MDWKFDWKYVVHVANYMTHYVEIDLLYVVERCVAIAVNVYIMTSWNANIFRVTGPSSGESIGHRWIPFTKANDAKVWCFLWSAPEQTVEQTIETPVIRDAIALIMMSL